MALSPHTPAATPKYDALGRLVGIENPDGSGYDYTYDDNGNRTNRIPYTASDITILLSHPAAGTVTGAGRFRTNTTTTLTATAAGGFDFVAWKRGDGTVLSTEPTYVYTVTATASITAEFRPSVLTIQPGPSDSHDIWTTSVYSYTGAGGGPGGGLDNDILRVGGWGDEYYSLLKFNLDGAPANAASATVHLYCFWQANPTAMHLDQVTSPWDWKTTGAGTDRLRLWWADRPSSTPYGTTPLPAPVVGHWYTIDITRLYNEWKLGTTPNHGIQLRPVSYFSNNFNTFYSSDTLAEPSLRPKLVVQLSPPDFQNQAPVLSAIGDQIIDEDASPPPVSFTVSDDETAVDAVLATVQSSNHSLLPNTPEHLSLSGTGANRTIRFTPLPNQFGETVITVRAADSRAAVSTRSFVVRVLPVNDPPRISRLADQTVRTGTALVPVPFYIDDMESPPAYLSVTATSSNPYILPPSGIVIQGSDSCRTAEFYPADIQTGTTTITLTVQDPEGGSMSSSFDLSVADVVTTHTIQPGPSDSHDIWTTSVYSYTSAGGGPGGGLDNDILRVGGWGDEYYSLLRFNLDGAPASAASATVHLYCFWQANHTAMHLDQVTSPWDWKTTGTGTDRLRLWWADRPSSMPYGTIPLPAPVVGQWYTIDITRLYNEWKLGTTPNHGIQLRPAFYHEIGFSVPYSFWSTYFFGNNEFNTFYSGDTIQEPSLRPKLVVSTAFNFDSWKAQFADAWDDPALSAESADPDHDGIPNLLEYAFGLSPVAPSTDGLPERVEHAQLTPQLVLRFRRRAYAPDLNYAVGVSPDLTNWHWRDAAHIQQGPPVQNDDGLTETVTVAVPPPVSDQRMYLKVNVSRRP